MTERKADHATFTIEKRLNHPPARVFAAYADPAQKVRWFGGDGAEYSARELEFRVGGREHLVGSWHGGVSHAMTGTYFDIVPDARIVFAYQMALDDKPISVSLGTTEMIADGAGTLLRYTEQGAYLDGFDDCGGREQGFQGLLGQLADYLDGKR